MDADRRDAGIGSAASNCLGSAASCCHCADSYLLAPACASAACTDNSSHGVHPNQIYAWKKQVLDNVACLFARGASGSSDGEEERERETAKLYAKIGQLTVERDFLARRPGR